MKSIKLTFPYQLKPELRKIPVDQLARPEYYPLLPITFYSDKFKSHILEGLVDSGAFGIFIPKQIAEFYNIEKKCEIDYGGVGGQNKGFQADIGFIIGRGGRTYDFGTVPATISNENIDLPILIGMHPLFDEFQVIFETYNRKFQLVQK